MNLHGLRNPTAAVASALPPAFGNLIYERPLVSLKWVIHSTYGGMTCWGREGAGDSGPHSPRLQTLTHATINFGLYAVGKRSVGSIRTRRWLAVTPGKGNWEKEGRECTDLEWPTVQVYQNWEVSPGSESSVLKRNSPKLNELLCYTDPQTWAQQEPRHVLRPAGAAARVVGSWHRADPCRQSMTGSPGSWAEHVGQTHGWLQEGTEVSWAWPKGHAEAAKEDTWNGTIT